MKTLSSILIITLGMLFFLPKKTPEDTVIYYSDTTVYYSEVKVQQKKDTINKVKVLLKHELVRIDYLLSFDKVTKSLAE